MTNPALQRVALILGSGGLLALPVTGFSQDADDAEIDEIVVISSKIEVPRRQVGVAVSVIEGEEIELRGFASVADVLRTQPGVSVSAAGGVGNTTSLRIRGEESFRTLVIVDGVRVSDPTTPQVGPSFDHLLTTRDLQRIEILRGPQGFMYGADAGGVVNILTRSGEGDLGGLVGTEFGSFGTWRVDGTLAAGNEHGDFFVSATNLESDGFNVRESDDVLMDDDGYDNTTVHGKFGWNATVNTRLELVLRDIDARSEFDGCGFPTSHDCFSDTQQTTWRLSGNTTAGSFTHSLAVSNLHVDRNSFTNGVSAFATAGDLRRAEYTGSYKSSQTTTLVYGADFQREDILTSSGDDLERDQTAFYAEYQGELGPAFYLSAGARYDDNEDFGEHVSIRIAGAYVRDLTGGAALKYRASYGTGFRAPSLFEISYNNGPFAFPPASGVSLKEESSSGFDIGFEYSAANGASLELSYFDQEIEDAIFFDLSGFSGYLQDPGTSHSSGVEFAWDVPLGEQWTVLGNLTWNDTEDTLGAQRIRRPELFGNLSVSFTSADEKFRVLGNLRTAQDAVDEIFGLGRVPLADHTVLDFTASYAVNDAFEVYGRVENAFDAEYQEISGFRTGGRAGYAGARFRF